VTRRTGSGALAIAVLAAVSMTSCAGEDGRSVASFCAALQAEKDRITRRLDEMTRAREQADDASAPLVDLTSSFAAVGELRTYFGRLAQHAPDEIRVQAETVAEEYDELVDSAPQVMTNPWGELAGDLITGMTVQGPMADMDEFAERSCGQGI
jgi:hypothetical protein